jgi:hypothetical protein
VLSVSIVLSVQRSMSMAPVGLGEAMMGEVATEVYIDVKWRLRNGSRKVAASDERASGMRE